MRPRASASASATWRRWATVDLPVDIPRMASLAADMVRKSLQSFIEADAEMARGVLTMDDAVDAMNRAAYKALTKVMEEQSHLAPQALNALMISRSLERVADHATNIAEDVIFWVQGADVRHYKSVNVQASRRLGRSQNNAPRRRPSHALPEIRFRSHSHRRALVCLCDPQSRSREQQRAPPERRRILSPKNSARLRPVAGIRAAARTAPRILEAPHRYRDSRRCTIAAALTFWRSRCWLAPVAAFIVLAVLQEKLLVFDPLSHPGDCVL